MTSDPLAALLVREGVLPSARVDEAVQRQALVGGTLDTAILELGALDERRLLELLARAYNARAVRSDELATVDKAVTGLFPRRLAEKHGVMPLDVNGRRLTVALAGPPDLEMLDEIGFMLSVYVKPAVTTEARVAWALAKHYGVPLPARIEALLNRVGAKTDEAKAAVDAWHTRISHKPKSPSTAPQSPPMSEAAAEAWSVAQSAGLPREAPSAPKLEIVDGGTLEAIVVANEKQAQAAADDESAKRRRERVMWTVDDAIAELALADDRDTMLDVVLRFAYRRLSTAAVFVANKSFFIGFDVIDPLLERKDIAAFTLPLAGSHALARVREMRSPFLGPLKADDPLVRLFGRRARAVMLVPILVGDRFVGVLYGDAGTRAIPPSSLAELHMVVPRLGKGLGNLILRKKKAQRAALAAAARNDAGAVLSAAATSSASPTPSAAPSRMGADASSSPSTASSASPHTPSSSLPSPRRTAPDASPPLTSPGTPPSSLPSAPPSPSSSSFTGPSAPSSSSVTALGTSSSPSSSSLTGPSAPSSSFPLSPSPPPSLTGPSAPSSSPPSSPSSLTGPSASSSSFTGPSASSSSFTGPGASSSPLSSSPPSSSPAAPSAPSSSLAEQDTSSSSASSPSLAATSASSPPLASSSTSSPGFRALPSSAGGPSDLADDAPSIAAAASTSPGPDDVASSSWSSSDTSFDDDLDIPVLVVGRLVEEDISVAEIAPSRVLPSIEIEAPTSLSSDPSPKPPPIPRKFTWADGKDDDEDVRLDESAIQELVGAALAAESAQSPKVDGTLVEEASLAELPSTDLHSVPDGAPLSSIPEAEGVMPAPSPAESSSSSTVGVSAVAASPGANARESLLAATYAGWIDHDDPELDELVGQLSCRGEKERKSAVAAVVAHGARALPSLARYFPGVLSVHPFGAMERRPDVADLSDCLACLTKLGADAAAPILCGELVHPDRLHRWSAVWALSALHVPGALPRLAQRLFDPELAIAGLALEILEGYRDTESFPKVLAQIRDLVRRGDTFEKLRAIAAVGELRDREALPSLVDLLGTRPKEVGDEARRALIEITKQDFGTAERRWRAWIADNDKTPRTRWLIDGLAAKDDDIRKSAQHELNRMTGQFFGYRWDAPRTDREASLAQWQDWWAKQAGDRKWP